jgi:Domain of unknown function (DUF4381)
MNPALQQLKDIHLPPAISLWPSAPGWIILSVVTAALLGYGITVWYGRRKQRYTIKYARLQLNQLQALMQHNPDEINIAAEISTLIRRTALYYFQRDAIAGLSGQEWLQFLNDSGRTLEFTAATGQLLIDAPYRKHHNTDLAPLFALTQNWLAVIAKRNRKEK